MFTGIVEARTCAWFEPRDNGARLSVEMPSPDWEVGVGDSVAVSGCCLTVVGKALRHFDQSEGHEQDTCPVMHFDLSAETLAKTWFAEPRLREVNVERALRPSDRLGGHLVSGHVDAIGEITRVVDRGDRGFEMHFRVPAELERYLIEKGSIAIDGISLTVVEPRGPDFFVAVIPETLKRTTLAGARPGRRVHLEADMIGKWIERLMIARA